MNDKAIKIIEEKIKNMQDDLKFEAVCYTRSLDSKHKNNFEKIDYTIKILIAIDNEIQNS